MNPDPIVTAHRNENPLGPPPQAMRRITEALGCLHRYPSQAVRLARDAVARRLGVSASCVLFTRGVDEATDLLLLHAGSAWGLVPGFDGFWERARALGVGFRPIELNDAWQPTTDPAAFSAGGVVLVANPNNPTGSLLPADWLSAAVASARLTCVDETYLDYAPDPRSTVAQAIDDDSVCVYVSFSKTYGLAGMRVGALIGSPELLAELAERQAFLPVDTVALAGVRGCAEDEEFLRASREAAHAGQARLVDVLRASPELFAEVRPTEAGFVLARSAQPAAELVQALRSVGVLVHDCAANRLDGWIRVSVLSDSELDALAAILQDRRWLRRRV